MLTIEPVAVLADNYAWLIYDERREAALVDPGEAGPVRAALDARGLRLNTVLATHHHFDHVGGIEELVSAWPNSEVVCSEHDRARVPAANRTVRDGERFMLLGYEVRCLLVPGHTLGAVAYYLPSEAAVFTGDTLFLAGCGRLFEGSAAQMHASLSRLKSLPVATRVFCGHEYTEKNLRFAASVEPDNPRTVARLAEVEALRQSGGVTVPASLEVELETNPFLRTHLPALQRHVGSGDEVQVFAELRRRRDSF